jgi:hypothetical protein
MAKSPATSPTSALKPTIIGLKFSADGIRAALLSLKGAEKGAETFNAVAPVFSSLIASGGTKAELTASTAKARVFQELFASTVNAGKEKFAVTTPTGKAFRAVAASALVDFAKNGRAPDQVSHDGRIASLRAQWLEFFPDAKPHVKDDTKESNAQVIARLKGELAAMTSERDALAKMLASITTPAQTPVTA